MNETTVSIDYCLLDDPEAMCVTVNVSVEEGIWHIHITEEKFSKKTGERLDKVHIMNYNKNSGLAFFRVMKEATNLGMNIHLTHAAVKGALDSATGETKRERSELRRRVKLEQERLGDYYYGEFDDFEG